MRRILFLTSFLVALLSVATGQNPAGPQLPTIIPNAPDATATIKGGEAGSHNFTGGAQASIPIYDIKLGSLSIPVALSYSSSGFKVDELPSKVGMNWSLSCNGVITRVVHDQADDDANTVRPAPPASTLTAQQLRDYYYTVTTTINYDTEPDEFLVSAPGLKTKFIIDDAGDAKVFPYSKIDIQILYVSSSTTLAGFIITNTNGIKYEFGKTSSHSAYDLTFEEGNGANITRTAFHLLRITLPDGRHADYTYTGNELSYYTGISQSLIRGADGNPPCPCQTEGSPCLGSVAIADNLKTSYNFFRQTASSVATITTSDGQTVTFDYEGFEAGDGEDTRINAVTIDAGGIQKTYKFSFEQPIPTTTGYYLPETGAGSYNPRFFLTGVSYVDNNAPVVRVGKYTLDYNNLDQLPKRLSFSQDYYGFYNGVANSTFLPSVPGEESYWGVMATADRGFHGDQAKKGMLDKITYPTGGYEKFYYEPNYKAKWGYTGPGYLSKDVTGTGTTASNGDPVVETYESSSFTLLRAQSIGTNLHWEPNPSCTGSYCGVPLPGLGPSSFSYLARLTIRNTTTNDETEVGSVSQHFTMIGPSVDLLPGTYVLKIYVRHLYVKATAFINYDPNATEVSPFGWVNEEAGGVRVKRIESYDPITTATANRYFTYAAKESRGKSSGNSINPEITSQDGLQKTHCFMPGSNGDCDLTMDCQVKSIVSSSLIPLMASEGTHITYSEVLESDDPDFVNGGIEHKFFGDVLVSSVNVHGYPILTAPNNTVTSIQGFELETNYFNSSFNTVSKVVYEYEETENTSLVENYSAKIFRLKFDYPTFQINLSDPLAEFDETDYLHQSNWSRLKSQTTYEYATGYTKTTTQDYYYDANGAHLNPVKVEMTDSKSNVLKTETKYPSDLTATTIYNTMVTHNMRDMPVEVVQKENTTQLTKTTSSYKEWSSTSTGIVIAPEILKFKNGTNTEEDRVRFYDYDDHGNPLKFRKQNDVYLRYVWDYQKNYPVAEAKNATGNIAYTSFEADGEGGWSGSTSGTITPSADAVTGKKYHSGTLSFSADVEADADYYFVTYWSGNSSAYSITHEVGSAQLLKTLTIGSKTWKLFRHKVSYNISDPEIALTGSGDIDELRLYPEGSQMATYAYEPFAGISAQVDINHTITYYEYDGLGRLKLVRDEHKNILRKLCYNHRGEIENCGMVVYENEAQSGSFTAVCNCVAGGSVTYTVPAGTYTSTNSVAEANTLALADVAANGQGYANSVGCSRSTVYARIEATSTWVILPSYYASLVIRFYCDSAYTIPIEVHNLNVNWRHHKTWCNEVSIPTDHTITCNGTETPLGTFTMESGGVNMTCYTLTITLLDGSGYHHPY